MIIIVFRNINATKFTAFTILFQFSGSLPTELFQRALLMLDVRFSKLSGSVPTQLANSVNMQYLYRMPPSICYNSI